MFYSSEVSNAAKPVYFKNNNTTISSKAALGIMISSLLLMLLLVIINIFYKEKQETLQKSNELVPFTKIIYFIAIVLVLSLFIIYIYNSKTQIISFNSDIIEINYVDQNAKIIKKEIDDLNEFFATKATELAKLQESFSLDIAKNNYYITTNDILRLQSTIEQRLRNFTLNNIENQLKTIVEDYGKVPTNYTIDTLVKFQNFQNPTMYDLVYILNTQRNSLKTINNNQKFFNKLVESMQTNAFFTNLSILTKETLEKFINLLIYNNINEILPNNEREDFLNYGPFKIYVDSTVYFSNKSTYGQFQNYLNLFTENIGNHTIFKNNSNNIMGMVIEHGVVKICPILFQGLLYIVIFKNNNISVIFNNKSMIFLNTIKLNNVDYGDVSRFNIYDLHLQSYKSVVSASTRGILESSSIFMSGDNNQLRGLWFQKIHDVNFTQFPRFTTNDFLSINIIFLNGLLTITLDDIILEFLNLSKVNIKIPNKNITFTKNSPFQFMMDNINFTNN